MSFVIPFVHARIMACDNDAALLSCSAINALAIGMPMYQARKIESDPSWQDEDGIKIYTISAQNRPVDHAAYLPRLIAVKQRKSVVWSSIPAFVIFHDGSSCQYLVLAWWGNGNELFTSVSVSTPSGWVEDPSQYSFCLWDLEVFWHERSCFIDQIYCSNPSLSGYRAKRLG